MSLLSGVLIAGCSPTPGGGTSPTPRESTVTAAASPTPPRIGRSAVWALRPQCSSDPDGSGASASVALFVSTPERLRPWVGVGSPCDEIIGQSTRGGLMTCFVMGSLSVRSAKTGVHAALDAYNYRSWR